MPGGHFITLVRTKLKSKHNTLIGEMHPNTLLIQNFRILEGLNELIRHYLCSCHYHYDVLSHKSRHASTFRLLQSEKN